MYIAPMSDAQRRSIHPAAAVLLIGHIERWNEVTAHLAGKTPSIEFTTSIHDAAARLALHSAIQLVVIEPQSLSRREWEMLALLKRHIRQPMICLPPRTRHEHSPPPGILSWEAAVGVWGQLWGCTPEQPQGNKGNSEAPTYNAKTNTPLLPEPAINSTPKTENPPQNRSEMPVVSKVVESYDEDKSAPILSDHEIRALLGP